MAYVSTTLKASLSPKIKEICKKYKVKAKYYLTQYKSLDDMPLKVAQKAAPILTLCYQNNSWQNPALATICGSRRSWRCCAPGEHESVHWLWKSVHRPEEHLLLEDHQRGTDSLLPPVQGVRHRRHQVQRCHLRLL